MTKARKRILLAGLYHETNTLLDGLTTLEDFQKREGSELLTSSGDGSPLAGFLEVADQQGDWDVIPAVDFRASPSAMVADDVVDTYLAALKRHLHEATREAPLDAIFLVLHGAMVSESRLDVEADVLQMIASELSSLRPPIFGVFDLHANLDERTVASADCLVGYRFNPHTDAHESAVRAAELLARSLRHDVTPRLMLRKEATVWPPIGTGTDDDPMRTLEAKARELEAQSDAIWALSIVPGFAYADTPVAGLSLMCVAEPSEAGQQSANEALQQLAELAERVRPLGFRTDRPVAEVVQDVLPVSDSPVLLVESADNIGGGAPGDATGALRALLDADVPSALIAMNDPAAVQVCEQAHLGDTVSLAIGGKGSQFDEGPVELDVEILSRSDGRFELEDRHSHMASMGGIHVNMGPTAVVQHRGITLLLTTRKTAPFDLGQFRSQGIEPTDYELIVVKAAVAHRRAYDPIAAAQYWVATPGPCPADLTSVPFRHVPHNHRVSRDRAQGED